MIHPHDLIKLTRPFGTTEHSLVAEARKARDLYEVSMESYARSRDGADDAEPAGPLDAGTHPIAPCEDNHLTLRRQGPFCFRDHTGSLLVGAPYLLVVNGTTTQGFTDEHGFIAWIDTSSVSEAHIYIGDAGYRLAFGDDPDDPVTRGQSMLNALGYSAGPLDGHAGPRTQSAVSYYQADRGLPVTGVFDEATLARLCADHRPT